MLRAPRSLREVEYDEDEELPSLSGEAERLACVRLARAAMRPFF